MLKRKRSNNLPDEEVPGCSSRPKSKNIKRNREKKTKTTHKDSVEYKYLYALNNVPVKVSVRFNLEFADKIKEALTDKQIELFKEGCFGSYLEKDLVPFSGVLCHAILSREIEVMEDDICFNVVGKKMVFGEREFGLISQLVLGSLDAADKRLKKLKEKNKGKGKGKGCSFRSRYFEDTPKIKNEDVVNAFLTHRQFPDSDAVMMANLYFVVGCLLEHEKSRHIPDVIIDMADYPVLFNEYPWGTLAYTKLIKTLSTSIKNREAQYIKVLKYMKEKEEEEKEKKEKKGKKGKKEQKKKKEKKDNNNDDKEEKTLKQVSYQLFGFPLVFQTWIIECWEGTHKFYKKKDDIDGAIPRVLQWKVNKCTPTQQSVAKLFNDALPPKTTFIEVNDEEVKSEWYKKLLQRIDGQGEPNEGRDEENDEDESPNEENVVSPTVVKKNKQSSIEDLKELFMKHQEFVAKELSEIRDDLKGFGARLLKLENDFSMMNKGEDEHDGGQQERSVGDDRVNGGEVGHEDSEKRTDAPVDEEVRDRVDTQKSEAAEKGDDEHDGGQQERSVGDDRVNGGEVGHEDSKKRTDAPVDSEIRTDAYVDEEVRDRVDTQNSESAEFNEDTYMDVQPLSVTKDHETVVEYKRKQFDYVPKELLDDYKLWLRKTDPTEVIPTRGIIFKPTTDWWRELGRPRHFLDSNHVTAWFWLLRNHYFADRPDWTSVSPDFMGNLGQRNMTDGWNKDHGWRSIKFFTKQMVGNNDLFFKPWRDVKRVLIPICDKSHWMLGVLELEQLHLYCYDSLFANSKIWPMESCLKERLPMLAKLMELIGLRDPLSVKKKISYTRITDIPQQAQDSNDCGLFTCEFTRFLMANDVAYHNDKQLWWFNDKDGLKVRQRIAVELYKGQLLESFVTRLRKASVMKKGENLNEDNEDDVTRGEPYDHNGADVHEEIETEVEIHVGKEIVSVPEDNQFEPLTVVKEDGTVLKKKRRKVLSKFLTSPFTNPERKKKSSRKVMAKKNVIEKLYYIPQELMDEYNSWLMNTSPDVGRLTGGITSFSPTTKWWKDLETPRYRLTNEHIQAWFYLLRVQYFQSRPEWTTANPYFIENLGVEKLITGWNGFWSEINTFTPQIVARDLDSCMKPWKQVKRILFPIYYEWHWILGVLDLEELHLYYYDSQFVNDINWVVEHCLTERLPLLVKLLEMCNIIDPMRNKKHISFSKVKDVPQQGRNSNDDGVFICEFARFLMENDVTDHNDKQVWWFKAEDGPKLRTRITVELYVRGLLENLPTPL